MKKITLLFVSVFLLTSCGATEETKPLTEQQKKYMIELEAVTKQYEEAKTKESEVLPEDVYMQKARLEGYVEKYMEAETTYFDGLKVYPKSLVLTNNLAMMYEEMGEYKKAETQLLFLAENAEYPKAYLDLFDLYKNKLKDRIRIIEIMEEGIEKYSTEAILPLKFAEYYESLENTAKAIQYYEAYAELVPDDMKVLERLAKLLYERDGESSKE